MKWLKRIRRDRRGRELRQWVPAMRTYVKVRYQPEIKYCITPLPTDKPIERITDMKQFAEDAKKDMALYDSPALQNTYHEWETQNSEHKSFSSEVIRMVEEKFKKPSQFYRPAGIDKRTYHKMKTDYCYKPSKKTAIRCCIGLKLNGEEAEALLKLAGYAFSPNDPDDLVVKFCLENGIWDIPGINYMLYAQATGSLDD